MEQGKKDKQYFRLLMLVILIVQLAVISFFCMQKKGFHYDEYYSYYSSNVTYGLVPSDEEWKSTDEIRSEFNVAPDAKFSYGTVNLMQTFDVHPPLYYFLLHTVCSLTPGVFSKWQGISINILFFILTWILLAKTAALLTKGNKKVIVSVCLLYGFSPAVYSGLTFIRMYMMLTFFCLLLLYIHERALLTEKRTVFSFYIPVILVSFLGFYTHYYFIVFLFFVAAYTFISMLLHKENRRQATCYAASVIAGILLVVMAYPACLSHIFRGYRGTEAMDAFFDIGNLVYRLSFFITMLNDYVLCFSFFFLILLILILAVTCRYLRNELKQNTFIEESLKKEKTRKKQMIGLAVFTVMGYFLVVAKTALLNAEEAIRYEMPVYGLIILLVIFLVASLLCRLQTESNQKVIHGSFWIITALTLILQLAGLFSGRVLFLYQRDVEGVTWAAQHKSEPIVYIYNQTNQWMIWDESEELMQYDEIYFINMEHESLKQDARLNEADHIYVYAVRSENSDRLMQEMINQNNNLTESVKVRELLYCDLYELK